MALRASFFPLPLFLCFLAATRTFDAAGAAQLQAIRCSTGGNYTATDAYAANLKQFLAALPNKTNGGFLFNGTVGHGAAMVYGLAMCSVDLPWSHCNDCVTDASSITGGLVKRCPGSATVIGIFDHCMLRYSNRNFFGTAETDIIFTSTGESVPSKITYSNNLKQGLAYLSAQAASSPERFAMSTTDPYAVMQCTWDLPSEKCKVCIDTLSANVSNLSEIGIDGERKSYSCRVRYSNSSFTVASLIVQKGHTPQLQQQQQPIDAPSPSPQFPNGTVPSPPPSSSNTSPPSSNGSSTHPPNTSPNKRSNTSLIIGAVGGTLVVVGSTLMIVLWCIKRKRLLRDTQMSRDTEMSRYETTAQQKTTVRKFTYAQLSFATDNFSDHKKLGNGSFGYVYKGVLADLGLVAVKKIASVTKQALSAYSNEVETVSRLEHPNLVHLLGSCHERGELLLVYELMQNGSLQDHLHGDKFSSNDGRPRTLSWNRRYKIALDMTNALVYMHKEYVVHRDIKPSNVLLDDQFNARVGDFGLVKEVDPDRTSQSMTIIGYIDYMDPEYKTTGKAGPASDIYSFGLVLLEMVSGQRPAPSNTSGTTLLASSQLVEKVKVVLRGPKEAIHDVVDKRLNGVFTRVEVERVLQVGLMCVQFDHHQRPTSTEVMSYLKGEVSVCHGLQPTIRNSIVCEYAPREFGYNELSSATDNFSISNKLGQGSFGEVYKGILGDDNSGITLVAVKRMMRVTSRTKKEYATEVDIIRRLSHRNLLRLIGWCDNGGVLIVVYELMENGCLSDHLIAPNGTGCTLLDWGKRYKIIVGIASALHYLHNDVPFQKMCVLHRDIKPSNVMLDESYEAKLGDFGLVKKVDFDLTPQTMTAGGTVAYLDPVFYKTGIPTKESDVYSFGVVMLQMALGRKPWINHIQGQFKNMMVEEAFQMYSRNEILDAVDKQLNGEFNKVQMERVIRVGLLCVQADPKKRPNSSRVMHYLKDLDIPVHSPLLSVSPGPAGPISSAPSIFRQQSDQYSTPRPSFV